MSLSQALNQFAQNLGRYLLIETDDGDVLALEIKPGKYYRSHAALDNALNTDGYAIDRAIVLAETNVFQEKGITYLPIYMLSMLINE